MRRASGARILDSFRTGGPSRLPCVSERIAQPPEPWSPACTTRVKLAITLYIPDAGWQSSAAVSTNLT